MVNEQANQEIMDPVLQDLTQIDTKAHKKVTHGLRGRKKLMADNLRARLGIVSQAAKETGITRACHYLWMQQDELYRMTVEDIQEHLKDVGEGALLGLLIERNPQVVLHFAKTKLKDRGYGDNIKVEGVVNSGMTLNLIVKSNEEIKNDKQLRDKQEAIRDPQSAG